MKWEPGRQGTGYEKLCIFKSERFKFDVYILRYRKGASVPPHIDPANFNQCHHRVNAVLTKGIGGDFLVRSNSHLVHKLFNRIFYFRPDICIHEVTKVVAGTRYVLSFGWITKLKFK